LISVSHIMKKGTTKKKKKREKAKEREDFFEWREK
jgi:hypothetical protein